jgi:hypothetical protein
LPWEKVPNLISSRSITDARGGDAMANKKARLKKTGSNKPGGNGLAEKGGPPVLRLGKVGKIKLADIRKAVRAVRDKKALLKG